MLGTLWPRYWDELTRPPRQGEPDPADTRLLLDGHGIPVPDTFSAEALAEAVASGDSALTEAANHAEDAAVTQYLAGVPDLLQRYELADQAQRAIVHAAMNARRLGHGEWLPEPFLRAAARAFLSARTSRLLNRDPRWFEEALARLTRVGRADTSILAGDGDGRYRLEDYLDQLGGGRTLSTSHPNRSGTRQRNTSRTRPIWFAWRTTRSRSRLRIATGLYRLARCSPGIAMVAETLADVGDTAGVEHLLREVDSGEALTEFVDREWHHRSFDLVRAERLLRRAITLGDHTAHRRLVNVLERTGQRDAADLAARQALAAGRWMAVIELMERRDAYDRPSAERMLDLLSGAQRAEARMDLAVAREETGDAAGADRIAHLAAQEGNDEVGEILTSLRTGVWPR